MRNDVREAVKCWANRPTWFSSHPTDAKELKQAVSNLKDLSPTPTFEDIKEALIFYIEDSPLMSGTPSNIHQTVREFAGKIYNKL